MSTRTDRRPNRLALKSLRLRLAVLNEELATCTTLAMGQCVMGAIQDTQRQIRGFEAPLPITAAPKATEWSDEDRFYRRDVPGALLEGAE
jgi:hypothetical protein